MNIEAAIKIALENLPKGSIVKSQIELPNEFLFIIHRPDPLEGRFDPFFKVNKDTGDFIDFSPQDYNNPFEIINQLSINYKE